MPQRRLVDPTAEMIELFAIGREIIAHGDQHRWEEQGGRRAELLRRAPHEVSVFEDLSGEEPGYMKRRSTATHPDFNRLAQRCELQQRLQALGNSPNDCS